MSALPLYAIITIAAGGGSICIAVAVTVAIVIHRRRKRRNRAVLENLRMSLQTGSNVDIQQVRTYSPTKRRTISWTNNVPHRNKLQRSPTHHSRTLRQASSRDSIKPLIKHKKSRDSFWKPGISIVDTSELDIIEPTSVYMPTGRLGKVPLTPISEKDIPPSHKSYRGVPRTSHGFAWNFGGPPRPLPVPEHQKHRSLSDSAAAQNFLNSPQLPKSILKKSPSNRSVSLQNKSPGPVPEQELPPTPKLPDATLSGPRRTAEHPADYWASPAARHGAGQPGQAFSTDEALQIPTAYNNPTTPAFLRILGRNITPPEYEQWEINNLRNMDNSPAHSTKSSIRALHMNHNSYSASVERSNLVRDKSSTLSLSLHDNWLTPSKPSVQAQQGGSRSNDRRSDSGSGSSTPSLLDIPHRRALQETAGNNIRQSLVNEHSLHSVARQTSQLEQRTKDSPSPEVVLQPSTSKIRFQRQKRTPNNRVDVQPSRPSSSAYSRITNNEVLRQSATQPEMNQPIFSAVVGSSLAVEFRPPSVAEFNPALAGLSSLYGLGLQREFENDPDFQNPNPEYSPLMSICRDIMDEQDQESDQTLPHRPQNELIIEDGRSDRLSVSPLEPRKRDTMTLPPPTPKTALTSSPPESPLKINESTFPRPSTSGGSTSSRPTIQPSTLSPRKHPGRRRKQNRSPLRQTHRPSDPPEPPPRSISRERLMKQHARITTTIMALRRQNSGVSTHDKAYFRLSGQDMSIGMPTLNRRMAFTQGFGQDEADDNDPFTEPRAKVPVREMVESERGLSPAAKRIMAEERREQYERRKSRDIMSGGGGNFGAIGEERKAKKVKKARVVVNGEDMEGLSPGELLTAAGAF